jgi:hypothetical protein
MSKALLIIERPWFPLSENPLQCSVLPFFQSVERLDGNISVYHASFFEREGFRAALNHLMGHEHERSILYIAAHGDGTHLTGGDGAPRIRLETALTEVYAHAAIARNIEGIILGSCLLGNNEDLISCLFEGTGLRWVVAYKAAVYWLPSSLIDMQIVSHMAAADPEEFNSVEQMVALFANALSLFNPLSGMAEDFDEEPVALMDAIQIWVRRAGRGRHGIYDITEQVVSEAWELND